MADKPENDGDESSEFAELREEIDAVERNAAKVIDPGPRGFVIAVLVCAMVAAELLPWVAGAPGWHVLFDGDRGRIPQLFAATSSTFGILVPAVTLAIRRWWMAWGCAIGACVATVDGMLSVWSQQSSGLGGFAGNGPGFGMVLALITAVLLAVAWFPVAWSRPAGDR